MAGERVLLVDAKRRRHLITLAEGGDFHTHAGVLPHDDIIGQPDGATVRTTKNARLTAVRGGDPGHVVAEDVVVAEGVAEEVAALEAALHGRLLGGGAHHRGDAGDVGVHMLTDGHALLGQRVLVLGDPGDGFLRVDEREGQHGGAEPDQTD